MPAALFRDVMRAALDSRRRVPELVAAISRREESYSEPEARLLAYHWWNQDWRSLEGVDRPHFFRALSALLPANMYAERTRVSVQLVLEEVRTADGPNVGTVAAEIRERLRTSFLEVLSGPHATYANLYFLNVDPRPTVMLLAPEEGDERQQVTGRWSVAVEHMLATESLSATERLIAHSALVDLASTIKSITNGSSPSSTGSLTGGRDSQ